MFHLLKVDDALREGILAGKTTAELEGMASGSSGLRQAALAHAARGKTTLEEVARVVGGA